MKSNSKRKMLVMVTIVLTLAITGLIAIDSNPVSAESMTDQTDAVLGTTPSFAPAAPVGTIVRMLCALAIVVVAVYGGLWLLKRLMVSRQRHNGGQALLEVIETACVGPKKNISLVRVADRTVLIGVTEGQISVLTEFDADETAVVLAKENEPEPEEGFGNLFSTAASKMRLFVRGRMPVAQES